MFCVWVVVRWCVVFVGEAVVFGVLVLVRWWWDDV